MTSPAQRTEAVLQVADIAQALGTKRAQARKGQKSVLIPLDLLGQLAATMRHYPRPTCLLLASEGMRMFGAPAKRRLADDAEAGK